MNSLTVHHYLYTILVAAGLGLAVFWVRAEIANARAEERSIASAEKQKDLQAQRDANDATAKKAVADLEAERVKPATTQTVIKYLPAPLPAGSTLSVQPATADKPAEVVLSGDANKNLQWIQDMEIKHAECDTNLAACVTDKGIAAQQFKAMTADRDNWKDTAKGGSKWTRLKKSFKVIGCAGAGAGLGSLLAKTKGAAIGAMAGASGCQIFW